MEAGATSPCLVVWSPSVSCYSLRRLKYRFIALTYRAIQCDVLYGLHLRLAAATAWCHSRQAWLARIHRLAYLFTRAQRSTTQFAEVYALCHLDPLSPRCTYVLIGPVMTLRISLGLLSVRSLHGFLLSLSQGLLTGLCATEKVKDRLFLCWYWLRQNMVEVCLLGRTMIFFGWGKGIIAPGFMVTMVQGVRIWLTNGRTRRMWLLAMDSRRPQVFTMAGYTRYD